jgi:polysaccharide export outer membrane protein
MRRSILILLLSAISSFTFAQGAPYRINPGDVLIVYVWNEKDLSQELLVHPDGKIGLPLVGQFVAGGLTTEELQNNIIEGLGKFMKDKPSVAVSIKQTAGNRIYVLGKVNRPGDYPISRPTDIMQALAMAGGLNAFAAENSINVLHRTKDGTQKAIKFRYSDVKGGDELQSNIVLESGDVVVVP